MLDLDPKKFRLLKPLTWEETFDMWRKNEADDPKWVEHYKSRGFESWEEWRKNYTEPFKCAEREWHLYKITNPLDSVPEFHGGPFKSWKEKYYGKDEFPTFAKLAQHPEIQRHGYVRQLTRDFPKKTTTIGLVTDHGIVIIEGMHRCCAMALAKQTGIAIKASMLIALAGALHEKLPLVGGARKNSL